MVNIKKTKIDSNSGENKKSALEQALDQTKRMAADYQNLEKRITEEKSSWIKIANKQLLLRLLPTLDTLMLAVKHVDDEGLKLAISQFQDAMKAEGIERIETQGQNFDPKTMEAVEVEEGEEGKVLEAVRAGYTLNGEVLRPAQVKVGKQKIDSKEEEKAKQESQRGDYM